MPGTREPCRYNQFDATQGGYLTVDYGLGLRQIGSSLSFNKLQASYQHYYKVERLRGTVFAGRAILGLATLINPRDRTGDNLVTDVDLTLPISERFFSGGSTTLRGFGYEEAGPRVVIKPAGIFRNRKGEPITLNPFTVPIGGNALAVLNAEARVPFTKLLQVVPFYDGGNVFRRVSDIFRRSPTVGEDPNLHVNWTHTVGLGIRVKTPLGGALAIDYGMLLNAPEFQITHDDGTPPDIIRLKNSQLHFRFTQSF
jgi:outer membrane protein assembly factor BamA